MRGYVKSKDRSAKLAPALQEVRTPLETAAAKAAPGATTAQVQDFGKAFADYMAGRMALVLQRICKALQILVCEPLWQGA